MHRAEGEEMCHRECGRRPIFEALQSLVQEAYPREFHSYTVDRASLTPSKMDPSFSSRDEAQKRVVKRAGCIRRALNGDIGYPCLFSLCFQLSLPVSVCNILDSRRRRYVSEICEERGAREREREKWECVKKRERKKVLSYRAQRLPLLYVRELRRKTRGETKMCRDGLV